MNSKTNSQIRLAIVGCSGNNYSDKIRLSKTHMNWIANTVRDYIKNVMHLKLNDVTLVSGGSAWCDHVAIQLYLTGDFAGLNLYLPSEFDIKQKKYVNTHEGRTLNSLHEHCANVTGDDIFLELTKAISRKYVSKTIKRGFLQRNTLIAHNCDYLCSFNFELDFPKTGGTAHTWNKTTHSNKRHYDLNDAK